jgi:hypothetical protein
MKGDLGRIELSGDPEEQLYLKVEMEKFQITKEGYQKLKGEIDNLKNFERPNTIKQIAAARAPRDAQSAQDAQPRPEAPRNEGFLGGAFPLKVVH